MRRHTYTCLLPLLVAALLHSTSSATTPPPSTAPEPVKYPGSYVIMAPATIRPGMRFRVGVNIRFLKDSNVTVTASIRTVDDVVASGEAVFVEGQQSRILLKLPDDLSHGDYVLEVTGSGGMKFTHKQLLRYEEKRMSLFIQTDKGIYKPGDQVNIRVFALFPNLHVYKQSFDISITDPNNNRIQVWSNVSAADQGVVAKDFTLASMPVLGDWSIHVSTERESIKRTFKVAKYVLPKFEVTLLMPPYALDRFEDIAFSVKAKYTFGKPLTGTMTVKAKLLFNHQTYGDKRVEPFININLPIDGEARVRIPLEKLQEVSRVLDNRKLAVLVVVTDAETGNTMNATGETTIYAKAVKMEFPKMNSVNFKPGLDYTAYIKVAQPDGLPIGLTDNKVIISTRVTFEIPAKKVENDGEVLFTSPELKNEYLEDFEVNVPLDGIATFTVPTNASATSILFKAKYEDQAVAELSLNKFNSPSNSFMQVQLLNTKTIRADDDITLEVKATQAMGTINYQLLARGELIYTGTAEGNGQSIFNFTLRAIPQMAPTTRLVIYFVREDGEIVSDSISFDISGAFRNQVFMELSDQELEPGNSVRFHIYADPGSYAYLLAVDQSVLLLASGNDISYSGVYDELNMYDYNYHGNLGMGMGILPQEDFIRLPHPIDYGGANVRGVFNSAGVIIFTDALVYENNDQGIWIDNKITMPVVVPEAEIGVTAAAIMDQGVRTHFPETWLWTDTRTCANGLATVVATVPDTITSWVASSFAINAATGFGMPESVSKLRVFKPFFVSLNLPYSVILGEEMALQVIIFNYLDTDQMVQLTLESALTFTNLYIDCNGVEYRIQKDQVFSVMVGAGQTQSVYFPIVPLVLGYIDIQVRAQASIAADGVMRQLLVEARGAPMEYTVPVLVDLNGKSQAFSMGVDISLPSDVVPESTLIRVSAAGDVMGPTISNLDHLLVMPTGCGEQTMISLAPIVYVVYYLQVTNKLTEEIRVKALRYMEIGYQNELNFRHKDGSFSAFANDESGSMWLTAFVMKVLHQGSNHITIDPNVLQTGVEWIINQQYENGSFPEPGRVIHKNMQGNAASGASLAAFVLDSLLENKDVFGEGDKRKELLTNAIKRCQSFLEEQVVVTDDVYFMTLAFNVLDMLESNLTDTLQMKLDQNAIVDDGLIHWHQPESNKASIGIWHPPIIVNSRDVEMTGYVLMTHARNKDLLSGKKIMEWMTKQRNAYGGFASTQDTVVGLYALSLFAELTHSDSFAISTQVDMDQDESYHFTVNQNNALVTQRRETKKVPTKVTINAKGRGLALVQLSVNFNVEKEVEDTNFNLTLQMLNETSNHLVLKTCASWLGEGDASGMAIQEIGVPSGFEADVDSIPEISTLKKIEVENKKVILYYDEIGRKPTCLTVKMDRVQPVARTSPPFVKVYDYYDPTNKNTVFYNSSILASNRICDICPLCISCDNLSAGNDDGSVTTLTEDEEIVIDRQIQMAGNQEIRIQNFFMN